VDRGHAAPRRESHFRGASARSQARGDVAARRIDGLVQLRERGHIAAVQMAALVFDQAGQHRERGIERIAPRVRTRAGRSDVMLQHLQIVQPPKGVLHALERPRCFGARRRSAFVGDLERVPELLRGDPHAMQRFGRVYLPRILDRLVQPARAPDDAQGEDRTPVVTRGRMLERFANALEPTRELVRVDAIQTGEHHLAPPFPLFHDLGADLCERRAGDGRPFSQLIGQVQRHIELANGAQRLGQTPQLALRFLPLRVMQALRDDRQRLAEAPRRHPRPMDTNVFSCDGCGQLPAERAASSFEQADQRERAVHGRMRPGTTERPVYNGDVTSKSSASPSVPRQMRIAAIDVGTNSIHMIVVTVRPDLSFEVIDREKEMVRLGAGGLGGRSLTPTAMIATRQTLAKFRRLADSHKVDDIVAAATSAVREADNGGDFIAEVEQETGIQIRVISGAEEARLIHLAAVYGVHMGGSPAVAIDIGGGSVEVTLGTASHVTHARSFKLGVIRLTERFIRTDPLVARDERRLVKHINKEVGDYLDGISRRNFERVIGTSGTILSLGALALSDGAEIGPDALRNRRVSAKAIHRVRKRLSGADLEARLHMEGLDPRRADIAVAGSIVLDTLLRRLGADEITLCDFALREGLVLDYIRRNTAAIRKIERYPDVRRRSVVELGERSGYSAVHARHVAALALSIFDQTRAVHGLGDREREWLEFGALLHDAGVHISYERHHRHSYYLIKNGELRGFDPQEIEVIALLARYHRQATPKKSHDGYGLLKSGLRRTVRTLAAMLRLAEGLDRSHAQMVASLDVVPRGDAYLIRLRPSGDVELELWAANRHRGPLEDVLHRPLRFAVSGKKERASHAEQPDHAARVSRKALRRGRHRRVRKNDAARSAGKVA
jgi:exopolyphosphatase/guanosine-5'-triphosphate,3'-diphosphate pyrophosphatase